jgi:hypothetical protein
MWRITFFFFLFSPFYSPPVALLALDWLPVCGLSPTGGPFIRGYRSWFEATCYY